MGLEFLRANGARRMKDYRQQPFLFDNEATGEEEPDEKHDFEYEADGGKWKPLSISADDGDGDWPLRVRRFVDGKDVGRTVAWLQSREGYPAAVRLAQIGAVVMREVKGELRREFAKIERVVSLPVDLFPWDEVESFAIALGEKDFRLLPVKEPAGGWSYDFEPMRQATENRSHDEMSRWERLALTQNIDTPTLIDGRLQPRRGEFTCDDKPIVGLIKTHSRNYLHPQGWQVFYRLQPGQRTPAFRIEGSYLPIVSWYLRLDGSRGEMPNYGVVRVEMAQRFFETALEKNFNCIDRLSRMIVRLRCRDESYGRAAISLHPIQRAEESLGAMMIPTEVLVNRFYRLTGL
jgi:hypothetical protein